MCKLVKITYEFLEPCELDSPTVYVITAHLDDLSTLSYRLMGSALNPNYLTTDRLYETLSRFYRSNYITDFENVLDEFVVDFITHFKHQLGCLPTANNSTGFNPTLNDIQQSLIKCYLGSTVELSHIQFVAENLYHKLLPVFEKLAEKNMMVRFNYNDHVANHSDILFKAFMKALTDHNDSLLDSLFLSDENSNNRTVEDIDDIAFFFKQCLTLNNDDVLPIYDLADYFAGVAGCNKFDEFATALEVSLPNSYDYYAKNTSTLVFTTVINSFYYASR